MIGCTGRFRELLRMFSNAPPKFSLKIRNSVAADTNRNTNKLTRGMSWQK
jgi:hypothetical protein